ncbi:hypothetical protein Tsp_11681 [Trichinella spiralis]|uniref:hypothetical protein n=1 Tax=Trichinella spiralis TaxID=6334 RepID=UPI0001EFE505|nr:hypothetical protein Tsp_11681 [Trichinella spiralis]
MYNKSILKYVSIVMCVKYGLKLSKRDRYEWQKLLFLSNAICELGCPTQCSFVTRFQRLMDKVLHAPMPFTASGQTLNDRLTAAFHSLAGSQLGKTVCKATTEEVMGPKKKHLDCKHVFISV